MLRQDFSIVSGGSNSLLTGEQKIFCDNLMPKKIVFEENTVIVSANVNVNYLIHEAAKRDLGGLEFLAGIPANIGGLVKMNAGAYGQSICPMVNSLLTINPQNETHLIKEFPYSYRSTDIDGYIYEIKIALQTDSRENIQKKVKNNIAQRLKSQPLKSPNLGCIFTNPENISAGELIDKANLKGKSIGGAKISEKHANFIINTGNATSGDVVALIKFVQAEIKKQFNITLTMEIKIS